MTAQYMLQFIHQLPSQTDIQAWVQQWGDWGSIIYYLWGSLSVFFSPLNFSAVGLAGGFLYGTFWATLINLACKITGLTCSFWLAQKLGRRVLQWFIPAKTLKKFDYLIENEKTFMLYTVLCFIPFTPSDTLAYIVGMSSVRYRVFLPVSIIANIGTAFSLAYIGSGGALHHPLFILTMGLALAGSLYYIHRHRKQYQLHD